MTEINKDLKILSDTLAAKIAELKYNKRTALFPDNGPFKREFYPKHIAFMAAGLQFSQRAFIAANRIGKTIVGAYEMMCHLTGEYPEWWEGRRFLNPISAWACGITNKSTKDIIQYELLGKGTSIDDVEMGTGLIPKHLIISLTKKPGVPDAVDTVKIRHKTGGVSDLSFLAYEQGREAFQGTKKQVIWLDEEPKDRNIYSECLTRTADKYDPGIIYCTFTPLFGMSDIVMSFLSDGMFPENGYSQINPHKYVTQVSWDEVPHLNDEQKAEFLAAYSPHERDARSKGIPSLGAGAIYPYSEDLITCEPFQIPEWWCKCYGMDVGWNRTAAVWLAQNPETGEIFAYSEHYQGFEQPAVHALAIKGRGDWIPGVVDPKADNASQADGVALLDLYLDQGLLLDKADNAVEAGIFTVGQLFASGQLKIFNTLKNLIKELRGYQRDESGKVVKKNDHACDALRYACKSGISIMAFKPDPDAKNNYSSWSHRDRYTGY